MADQQADYYNHTLTGEIETVSADDQSKNDVADDTGSKQTGSSQVTQTNKKHEATSPKQIVQQLDAKGQVNTQSLSAPGWYYFDGENCSFSKQRPDDIYVPGSDYCHVLKARDTDDDKSTDKSDSSLESDSSDSTHSDEDIQVRSKLSGMKTLNINIRLNLADLVQTSTGTRRRRHKERRHKTVRRVVRPLYENQDIFNNDSTVPGKEPVENSLGGIRAETDDVFEQPPRRPPKSFQLQTWTEVKRSKKPPDEEQTAAGYQDEETDVMATIASVGVQTGRNLTRHSSEPVPNLAGSQGNLYSEDWYSQIGRVSDQDYDAYSSDAVLQKEVIGLSGTYQWFYLYNERQKAEAVIADTHSPDGTFAMISENIEVKPDFPFTLLLKFRGKMTETPIKRIVEFRKKRYELLNTKKDTILKLVEYFRQKPLPRFKITLR